MKAYSKDLRVRVLAAVDRGVPRQEIAGTFSVSVSTIKRYPRLRRQTGGGGQANPRSSRTQTGGFGGEAAYPGRTQARTSPSQSTASFSRREHGIGISTATMSRVLKDKLL